MDLRIQTMSQNLFSLSLFSLFKLKTLFKLRLSHHVIKMTLQTLVSGTESIPMASLFQHPNQSPERSHLTSPGKGVGELLCSSGL